MEAVSSIPASGDNASEAGMSEAWRVFLQSRYRAGWALRVSRYKVSKWTGIYHGIVILLTVVARSGFVKRCYPVLVAGAESKKCDKQLTFIVRVRHWHLIYYQVVIISPGLGICPILLFRYIALKILKLVHHLQYCGQMKPSGIGVLFRLFCPPLLQVLN